MASNGYHCEIVGSLLRHDELKQAMERDERGEMDPKQLEALQEEEGVRNIALQEEAGVEVLTDGEVRRRFWFDPLTDSLSGYNPEVPAPVMFHGSAERPEGPPPKLPAVTEKLGIRHNLPSGERWVRVVSKRVGDQVRVIVTNTGPEIPPYEVDSLFKPFFRLGAERLVGGKGAGLGLSIVRSVAEAHAGTVTALPREGGGLQVTVTLPLDPA